MRAGALVEDFTDPKFRFERATLLHAAARKLQDAVRACDFRNEVIVRADGVFVSVGGVLLDVSYAGSYLKSSGDLLPNQGEALQRALTRFGIGVSSFVDVGANFGEVALWFAREHPHARIVAVEPSSANAKVLRRNQAAQAFPTSNLELIQEAVGDKRGTVVLTKGAGPMARVVAEEGERTERVTCDRLDHLFERYRIERADFVKIDIEGSEPALREAVIALGERVRAYYIEFSQFAPAEAYLALAQALIAAGFTCYDEPAHRTLAGTDGIERYLRIAFAAGPIAVTNLWFVRH